MITYIAPGLFDGFGNANYQAIAFVFDLFEVENPRTMFELVQAYIRAVKEEMDHG